MKTLLYAFLTFFIALSVHFVIWKVCLPKKNRPVVLVNIFFGVLLIGVAILGNYLQYMDYIILYCSLAFAYILSYPAMEADSPSLAITYNIAKAAKAGLAKLELYKIMTDQTLVVARINDLLSDGLICIKSERYFLTSKGLFLARLFVGFRKLLNLPKGG